MDNQQTTNECDVITLLDMGVTCNVVDPTIQNPNGGILSVLVTGGSTPYTIVWETDLGFYTGQTMYNKPAGLYTVRVYDAYNDYSAQTTCELVLDIPRGYCQFSAGISEFHPNTPTPTPTPTSTPTPTPTHTAYVAPTQTPTSTPTPTPSSTNTPTPTRTPTPTPTPTVTRTYPPSVYQISFPGPKTNTSILVRTGVSDGGSPITSRVIYYSTINNPPTPADNAVVLPSVSGLIDFNVTGLSPNTGYYFACYATNANGVGTINYASLYYTLP